MRKRKILGADVAGCSSANTVVQLHEAGYIPKFVYEQKKSDRTLPGGRSFGLNGMKKITAGTLVGPICTF